MNLLKNHAKMQTQIPQSKVTQVHNKVAVKTEGMLGKGFQDMGVLVLGLRARFQTFSFRHVRTGNYDAR